PCPARTRSAPTPGGSASWSPQRRPRPARPPCSRKACRPAARLSSTSATASARFDPENRSDEGRPAMRVRNNPMTPLAAVVAGLLAGAVGTVCLDAVQYLKYRRTGGTDRPLAWEFAPVESWETAPDPGQVARRVIEGFTQRKLPDRSAWLTSTIAHWAYGSAAGAAYGILAGSLPTPRPEYGGPVGAVVFAKDCIGLPIAGLYQPIWEYDAKTLAWDLGAHLAYGAGTGTTFWLLTRNV